MVVTREKAQRELSRVVRSIHIAPDACTKIAYAIQLLRTVRDNKSISDDVLAMIYATGENTRRRVGYLAHKLSMQKPYTDIRPFAEKLYSPPNSLLYFIDDPPLLFARLEGPCPRDKIGKHRGIIASISTDEVIRLYEQQVRRVSPLYASYRDIYPR